MVLAPHSPLPLKDSLQGLVCSFNYSLMRGELGDTFFILYSPLLQELIKCLGGIRGPVIYFDDLGDPQHGEGLHQVFLGIRGLLPRVGRGIDCSREDIDRDMHVF